MSLRTLPQIRAFDELAGLAWEPPADAIDRWTAGVRAAAGDQAQTIDILDVIGQDPWSGGGVTARRISGALRSIGATTDVVVNINSPGGDAFEGIAIYNMLREHKARVSVNVLGMAASAASIIAMAGDDILIGRAAFLMIHDTWAVAIGNRHDMTKAAEALGTFDAALADVYAARSGQDQKAIAKMMDAETWLNGSKAVELGLATGLLDDAAIATDPAARAGANGVRDLDTYLARHNVPRSERRALLRGLKSGTHDAAEPVTHDADHVETADALRRLAATLKA
jgi:ATP-dependent Clp protease protease subunit